MTPHQRRKTRRDQEKREQAAAQRAELLARRPLVPLSQARRPTSMYLRMSLDSNLLGEGIDRQHYECYEKTDEEGLDVVALHIDNDTSASTDEPRPGFDEMKDGLGADGFKNVIAWSQDRLLRKPRQMEDLIDIAEFHPAKILSVMDETVDLTTASGRKTARNRVSDAAFESERKTERQRARTRQSARTGATPIAECFGYDIGKNADGKRIAVINPAEAAIVREVFELYVSGVGVSAIVEMMNARGLVNTWGNKWTRATVTVMLRNPRYIGERWVQTRVKTEGGKRELVTTQVLNNDGTPVMGDWEPIFSGDEVDSLFRAAGHRMAERVSKTWTGHTGTSRKWVGTGLYYCDVCGNKLTARYLSTRKGKYLAYMCYPGSHVTRNAADVDLFVRLAVAAYLRRFGVAELLADKAGAEQGEALKETEGKIVRKLARVETDYDNEDLDGPAYRVKKTALTAELESVRADIAALAQTSVLSMLNGSADPAAAFLEAPLTVRAAITRELGTVTMIKGKRGRRPPNWRKAPGFRTSDTIRIEWHSGRTMDMTEFDVEPVD